MDLTDSFFIQLFVCRLEFLRIELGWFQKPELESEIRSLLHDIEEFANVILQGSSGENHALLNLERAQLLKEFTLIIFQRLALIHNQTFPSMLPQKRDVRPCGAIPRDDHVCLEIQHSLRPAKFIRFLRGLTRSGFILGG